MELTKRLKKIASLVDQDMSVADIGCDHGYIPIYLAKEGISGNIIAMDVNKGPMEKAERNGRAYLVDPYITYRLSNGLDKLEPGEVDCVIIAGMGGKLIESILKADVTKSKTYQRFIVSPHRDVPVIREALAELGFLIIEEDLLLEDGHYYHIIVGENTQKTGVRPDLNQDYQQIDDNDNHLLQFDNDKVKLLEIYNKYGKLLIRNKHPLLKEEILKEITGYGKVLNEIKDKDLLHRVEELKRLIEDGKKVLEWLE